MSQEATSDSTFDNDADEPKFQQPIRARALRNTFHFWKFLVMGLAVFVYGGGFFLYDGFVKYPRTNRELTAIEAQISEAEKAGKPVEEIAPLKKKRDDTGKFHNTTSLLVQRGIGFICAPIGAWLLLRHLRATSGQYLLENDVLTTPRKKRIPMDSVTAVRNAKWMTKGLAYFDYKKPDGEAGTFTLDALAYETKPSDAIHDELVRNFRVRTGESVKTAKELKKD